MKTTQEEIIEKIEELKNAMLEMQESSQAEENIKLAKIKGHNEPIEVGIAMGSGINKIWLDPEQANDTKITVDGMNFIKGDIRWINLKSGTPSIKSEKAINIDREYKK